MPIVLPLHWSRFVDHIIDAGQVVICQWFDPTIDVVCAAVEFDSSIICRVESERIEDIRSSETVVINEPVAEWSAMERINRHVGENIGHKLNECLGPAGVLSIEKLKRDKDAKAPVQVAQAARAGAKTKPSKTDGSVASPPADLIVLLGLLLLILAGPMLWLRRRKTA